MLRWTLNTERLILRLPEAGDAEAIADLCRRNVEFFSRLQPASPPERLTAPYWRERADAARAEFRSGSGCQLFLFARDGGDVIGSINLFWIVRHPMHAATVGYSIDEARTRRGLMTEALREVVRFAFEDLKLHRLAANYAPGNVASARVLRKLGFVNEGYAREYLLVGDQWIDNYNATRLNADWRPADVEPASAT
jgi:ribosomal-protein-alanine N-acetyltransferase